MLVQCKAQRVAKPLILVVSQSVYMSCMLYTESYNVPLDHRRSFDLVGYCLSRSKSQLFLLVFKKMLHLSVVIGLEER